MLYQDKISEGISVELVVQDGEYKGRYRTKIEEVGTRILSVGVPLCEGQFIPLREGTILDVIFNDEYSAYTFSSYIIRRLALPIPTFIIEFPNKINKVQRRQYVRVPIVNPVVYSVVTKDGISKEKKGFTADLSGGGMLLRTFENLPPETMIMINTLIGENNIDIQGITIRSIKEDNSNYYDVSVMFIGISERIRDKIISYVFDIQRQMRRKGLV